MEISNEKKKKAILELAPLTNDLNRKMREIIEHGIDLNVYVYKDEKLLGKQSVICIDVFKQGE